MADATLDALADTVRERVPITSVIGETTDLIADEDGSSYLGQCPLCHEGQIIITERAGGIWRCKCAQGDVIRFVELHRGITHHEAVVHLYSRLHGTEPGDHD